MSIQVLEDAFVEIREFDGITATGLLNFIIDFPDIVIEHLGKMQTEWFMTAGQQHVFAGIMRYLKAFGVIPSRPFLLDYIDKQMIVGDPHEEVRDIINMGSNPRETPWIRKKLIDWMKKQAHNSIFSDDCVAAANSGDFNRIYKAVEFAKTVGDVEDGPTDIEALLKSNDDYEWVVENALLKYQPCVVGGASKTLKTSIALDMAISVASGTKFLDRYKAHKHRVMFLSGESGQAAIRNTAKAIMKTRGISGPDINGWLMFSWKLPKLSDATDIALLRRTISKYKIDVLFIDPLYLCLTRGSDLSATNIFDMGTAFGGITSACQEERCTLILVHHHNRKGNPHSRPTLADLSMAGAAEFCRQYILISRQKDYRSNGIHDLYIKLGREGGCEDLDLTIDEGIPTARKWGINLTKSEDVENQKKVCALRDKSNKVIDVIYELIKQKEEPTNRKIREACGLSGSGVKEILEFAIASDLIQKVRAPSGTDVFVPLDFEMAS